MSEVLLEIATKIEKKMSDVISSVEEVQKRQDKFDEKIDSNSVNTESKEAIEKAAKDATDALAEVNKLKEQATAITKAQEFIEKSISRLGEGSGASGSELSEMEAKAGSEMANYLRYRTPISDETNTLVVSALLKKNIKGASNAVFDTEVKKLTIGSNVDSGYHVRPERSTEMIKRIFETSNIRGVAKTVTSTSDTFEIVISDDQSKSGGWVGEVDDRDETDTPKIGMLTIPIHEQFAEPRATQKTLDDVGFDIESWLINETSDILTRDENTAFVRGNGSQKPRGILNLPDWGVPGVYERNALERRDSGVNGDFDADAIIALQGDLKGPYQPRAVFAVKRAAFTNILQLKDSQGQYLINPMILREGGDKVLLGKPVLFWDDLDGASVNGQSLIYADFSLGYTIVDRIGFRLIRDNVTKKGLIKFYLTKRVGGDVTNFEAIKIMRLRS